MIPDGNDSVDRAIDTVLASMVGGEPRGVSGASVREAAARGQRSSLPMWLAAAAVLVLALGVALKDRPASPDPARATEASVHVGTRSTPPGDSVPTAAPAPARRSPARRSPALGDRTVELFTEGPHEGLPRLSIASIETPEPLRSSSIDADPIQIPGIEIAPLSVSSLSIEQEHK